MVDGCGGATCAIQVGETCIWEVSVAQRPHKSVGSPARGCVGSCALVVLPMIVGYTVVSCWIFRGKAQAASYGPAAVVDAVVQVTGPQR